MELRFTTVFSKSRILWLSAVVVALLLSGFIWYSTTQVEFVVAESQVVYRCPAGKTVLNALVLTNSVEFEQTSNGPTVTAINAVVPAEGQQWSFMINGEPSNNSGLIFTCSGTEQIVWQIK